MARVTGHDIRRGFIRKGYSRITRDEVAQQLGQARKETTAIYTEGPRNALRDPSDMLNLVDKQTEENRKEILTDSNLIKVKTRRAEQYPSTKQKLEKLPGKHR